MTHFSILKKHKCFTLIEMTIVVVIIGIFAIALIPKLIGVQERARDTQRKTDLKTIFNALEIYKNDKGVYASSKDENGSAMNGLCPEQCWVYSTANGFRIGGLSGYMTSMPRDPINKQLGIAVYGRGPINDNIYVYQYGNLMNGGRTYDLSAQLENKKDPDRCELKKYLFKYPGVNWCGQYPKYLYEYSPDSNSF